MNQNKIYLPLRNLVGSLVPTIIVTWYFIDKAGQNSFVKVVLILIALVIQIVMVVVSSKTRKTRHPFFWGVYNFLTGNGRLPLRLFVNGMVAITLIALGFEISGLKIPNSIPSSFIARFVNVDIYWTSLNFLGISDNSIEPIGFSKFLTIIATITGLIFWGMYISILINKHAEIQNLLNNHPSDEDVDIILFNELNNNSKSENNKIIPVVENQKYEKSDFRIPEHHQSLKSDVSLPVFITASGLIFWILGILTLLIKNRKRK